VTYDANKSAKKNKKNEKKNHSANVAKEKKEDPKEGRIIKEDGKVDPQSNFKDNLKKVRYR
jgi:hypothetical protein